MQQIVFSLHGGKLMKNKIRKAIALCTALTILCHTMVPLKANAVQTPSVISSIEALPYDVAYQVVSIGAEIADIFLPETLLAQRHEATTTHTDEPHSLAHDNTPLIPQEAGDDPLPLAPEASEHQGDPDATMPDHDEIGSEQDKLHESISPSETNDIEAGDTVLESSLGDSQGAAEEHEGDEAISNAPSQAEAPSLPQTPQSAAPYLDVPDSDAFGRVDTKEHTQETAIPIHWEANDPFSSAEEAVFVFTPILPSEYMLAAGVLLPSITVYVQAQQTALRVTRDFSGDEPVETSLSIGDKFISDDVVYCIITLPEEDLPGTVQIGDGVNPAIPDDCHGKGFYSTTVAHEDMQFTIVAVADRAFADRTTLSYVHLPTSVLHVGQYAFAGSFRLTGVYFADYLESIGEGAFDGCDWDLRINFAGVIPPSIPDGLWLNHSRKLSINVNEQAYDTYVKEFSPHCNEEATFSPFGTLHVITESQETEPAPLYAGVITYEDSELTYIYFPAGTALNALVLQNMAEQLSDAFAPLISWYITNADPEYQEEADLEYREVFLYRLNTAEVAILSADQLDDGTNWFDHEEVASSFFEDFTLIESDNISISSITDAQYPLLWMEYSNNRDVHFIDIEGELTAVASQLRNFAVYDVCAVTLAGMAEEVEPLYALTLDAYPRGVGCVAGASRLEAHAGNNVRLTVQAGEGYRFKEWYTLPAGVSIVKGKLAMPAHDVTVVAIFERVPVQPEITHIVANAHQLSHEGGPVELQLSGNMLDGVDIVVRAFNAQNGTAIVAQRRGAGAVQFEIPKNTQEDQDSVYVVRASVDQGKTWSDVSEVLLVQRAPSTVLEGEGLVGNEGKTPPECGGEDEDPNLGDEGTNPNPDDGEEIPPGSGETDKQPENGNSGNEGQPKPPAGGGSYAGYYGGGGSTSAVKQKPAQPKGWTQTEEGTWEYYNPTDGKAVTGKQTIAGKKYMFSPEGVRQEGWVKDNGKTYYCGDDGVLCTGLVRIDGTLYYFTAEGTLLQGFTRLMQNIDKVYHMKW